MAEWHHSEIAAFERFGYRYSIDAYPPHITLAPRPLSTPTPGTASWKA
jgi:hypothetical protein